MAETKVTSIRASEETTMRFKELSEQFPNSAECLKAMINAYEMSQAKGVLSGQETYINDFQSHLDSIMRAYISVLDLNANAENRIRDDFKASLESKDKIILDLQGKLAKAEENATSINDQNKKLESQIAELTAKLEQSETAKQSAITASDAQKVTIDTLNEKLNNAVEKAEQAEELKKDLAAADQRSIKAEKELQELKHANEIASERAEIDKEKAVLAERSKATERIQELVDETKKLYSEINELRKKPTKSAKSKKEE